jgi:hypothetical protein
VSDEILSRIAGWCGAENDLEIEGQTITVGGDPPLEIGVDLDDEAVTLTHMHSAGAAPEGFAEHAVALLRGRGSVISGEVTTAIDNTIVHIRYPIYLDGLNRQTFLLGIRDISAASYGLTEISKSAPAPGSAAIGTSGPQPPAEKPGPGASAATTETAVIEQVRVWAPTHIVPAEGMPAWVEPDPAQAPVVNLAARVELRIDEQRGAWARVTGSNGWTGWVDARRLLPFGTATVAPAWTAPSAARTPGATGGGIRPLALIGGMAMAASAFLEWGWTSAMNLNLTGIWPLYHLTRLDQPRIGLTMLFLGVIATILALVPRTPAAPAVLAGILGIAVPTGFIMSVALNWQLSVLFDLGFIGMWLGLVGGLLATIRGPQLR